MNGTDDERIDCSLVNKIITLNVKLLTTLSLVFNN